MNRILVASTALIALTACTKGTIDGKVTDGLTGQPVAELRVIAKAPVATDLTCMALEGSTDASGAFHIEGTCAGNEYVLSLADDTRFIEGSASVAGGEPVTQDLKTWIAPEGSGIYVIADGELQPQKTYSDVAKAVIMNTEQEVRYPETAPKDDGWPQLATGSHVLLLGEKNVRDMGFELVLKSPEVKFAPEEGRDDITHWSLGQEWSYIGIQMAEDGSFELKQAEVDTSKFVDVAGSDRTARYVPAEALAPGRYALLGPKSRRTYVFEVGGSAAAPAPEGEATE